ncbi:unnamed protein product [Bursaphelenchus xylophilus]|uniref:(pine wood nematode) hypothetical protein n=1 Tax=Bursaphelenchus xylophilus TaxID=6326 RepID=A0A1I7RT15_BURXY|nr:unnamed protein product [Bursaphelenchus xylophilus]CAG9122680.1 unnamed protein product [Bursaphelenchus xylophilus]
MKWLLLLCLVQFILAEDSVKEINAKCRGLLSCSIKKNCVQMNYLIKQFDQREVNAEMYDALDKAIDYGCIFTSGCLEECNRCPLCQNSKQQLVDVLSGSRREEGGECSTLVNCASDCVADSGTDISKINYCLKKKCAFHCFDGSCQKCSAFVTRIFNQVCVSGELRSKVKEFEGHCYEMFREIVYQKFTKEFEEAGLEPSIGNRGNQTREN